MKKSSWIILICALAAVLVALLLLLVILSQREVGNQPPTADTSANEQNVVAQKDELPWENGGKKPLEYTWEEFGQLSGNQQMAFQDSFGSFDEFYAWLEEANPDKVELDSELEIPWKDGGKKPSEYTWEEFIALDAGQQMAFQNSFGSFDAFDAWLQKVNPEETEPDETESKTVIPWENGGKKPSEYTYEEFESLSAELQMVFQNSFSSIDEFDKWLQKVHPDETKPDETEPEETESKTVIPWENGGKKPSEYTYEEFESLNAELQMVFQKSFSSIDEFDKWLQKVHPDETEPEATESKTVIPWENGGKQPSEYTWAEFEALSAELQMAFQKSFSSIEEFDKWLQKTQLEESEQQNTESDELYIPWENGGKKPSEYTYEEFEELDAGQQMAFQKSFGSIEEFDKWLQKVNPQ